jgi:tetratricopeptide (TPR) repeat protein
VRRVSVVILSAALIVLAVRGSVLAQTPWYVSYEKALSLQDQGDWKGSLQLLRDALAGKDAPKLKARTYGLRFVNYLPYFHLGEAYYNLGEQQKAIENYDLCLKYGEIQQAPDELALLQAHRTEVSGVRPGIVGAPPAVKTEMPEAAPPVPGAGLAWYVNYESGLAYIESGDWLNAIENLKLALAANGIPRRYARTYGMWFIAYIPYYYLGVAYYNQGMWQLAVNYFETSERLDEVKGLESESSTLKSFLEEARKKSAGARKPAVSEELKSAVNTRIAEAVRLFNREEYGKAESVFRSVLVIDPYNSVAKNYIARIAGQSGKGEKEEAPPPKEFSSGVLELLKGRHEQAIRLLKTAEPGMGRDASLHAYLGVAYCLRHRAAGKKETESIRNARAEFRRALEIDPSYQLDRTLFSRDVIDVFQGVAKK